MELKRHPSNPILLPDPNSDWESYNVFNPAVIHHNDLFHMFYRAQGLDWVSRIGYAVSEDGLKWNRLRRPILEPVKVEEARGIEDPRVTELNGVFYMAYTAYSGQGPGDYLTTPMFARSTNLLVWNRIGPLVRGEDNKDHFLLPRKIKDKYVAFHRRDDSIWLAESDDMVHWPEAEMRLIMSPRQNNGWDSRRIGGNGPPIPTEYGWLFFYHGYDDDYIYRIGGCLLDLEDPGQITNRPKESIFEPKEIWELRGDVSRVVFSCANLVVGDQVYVYYGAADHVIGLATCDLSELLVFLGK